MPFAGQGYCLVQIDDNTFFLAGSDVPNSNVWIYNMATDTWTQKTSITLARRAPTCGLVVRDDGSKEVVVAGGFNGYSNSVDK